MRIVKLCTAALIAVGLVGVTGCVQQPPTPGSSGPASSGSTASSTPTRSPTPAPNESPAPNSGSTPLPTDAGSPGGQPVEADVQILDARFDPASSGISVAGMVVNVVSNAGVCTVVATQNDVSVSATATSVADASVTYCASLVVPLPAGSAGEWAVSLSYDEGVTHGTTTSQVAIG